jgi:hypothetical protein
MRIQSSYLTMRKKKETMNTISHLIVSHYKHICLSEDQIENYWDGRAVADQFIACHQNRLSNENVFYCESRRGLFLHIYSFFSDFTVKRIRIDILKKLHFIITCTTP